MDYNEFIRLPIGTWIRLHGRVKDQLFVRVKKPSWLPCWEKQNKLQFMDASFYPYVGSNITVLSELEILALAAE